MDRLIKHIFKYAPNMLQRNDIRFHCYGPLDRKTFESLGIKSKVLDSVQREIGRV
jgi:hypothetical protein